MEVEEKMRECIECGTLFYEKIEICEKCGSYTVKPLPSFSDQIEKINIGHKYDLFFILNKRRYEK